jgi:hypothetical protein
MFYGNFTMQNHYGWLDADIPIRMRSFSSRLNGWRLGLDNHFSCCFPSNPESAIFLTPTYSQQVRCIYIHIYMYMYIYTLPRGAPIGLYILSYTYQYLHNFGHSPIKAWFRGPYSLGN